jgi:hypothetical protein
MFRPGLNRLVRFRSFADLTRRRMFETATMATVAMVVRLAHIRLFFAVSLGPDE